MNLQPYFEFATSLAGVALDLRLDVYDCGPYPVIFKEAGDSLVRGTGWKVTRGEGHCLQRSDQAKGYGADARCLIPFYPVPCQHPNL